MKRSLFSSCCLWLAGSSTVFAIPQNFSSGVAVGGLFSSVPRLDRDLTEDFLTMKHWDENKLEGPWVKTSDRAGQETAEMTANPTLLGWVPGSVRVFGEAGRVQEIIINYLDAGKYFGFDLDGEKTAAEKMAGDKRRAEFLQQYGKLASDLHSRLEKGCGAGRQTPIGRTPELKTTFQDYRTDGFLLRLELRENFSVALHIQRENAVSNTLVDPSLEKMKLKDRRETLKKNVQTNARGDTLITGLPSLQQGNTPFCGIHSLAMVSQYHGLRLEPEELAAGAEFKNTGNAKGSNIPALYRAVGDELGLKFQIGKNIDRVLLEKLIADGMPVIVWRRVTQEREDAHTLNTRKILADPTAALPPLRDEERSYPDKNNRQIPSHASVICGYNHNKGEVIFSEPWGNNARERRMRIEEMEATVYQTFLYKL